MNNTYRKLLFALLASVACLHVANAQLPNEKFGKPSNLEWDYIGWGNAIDADAIILCKTMKATYELSDQVFSNNLSSDIGFDDLQDFGKNQIDESNTLVKYEFRLRTKILKAEGARHANIDITYFNNESGAKIVADELSDLKIRVFSKNAKGKVEKRNVDTGSFATERIDDNFVVMHVVVPDVEAGSIIEYQYNITSPRPAYIYDWVFQECIPTVRSKCDIEIPAFLQFNMNVPINKLIKSSVEVGHLAYDTNRTDMKRGKTCVTNHYKIVGDYILPEGFALKRNQGSAGGDATEQEIAIFTSQINMPNVTIPVAMPQGHTHLKVR
ncbi:MAG: DUF3857 domain-containing protein [Prevotella sp.]|nr:DUF3857 domain-containing protein [Prevotella sp.]